MDVDDIDKGILYLLQNDARRITTEEMGERVGVSASTVRNRIGRMEDEGIVRGYHPDVDYDEAGFHLYTQIISSAPNPKRAQFANEALTVNGVVAVREVLNGHENLQIQAVGMDADDIARITNELSDIGLDVVNTKIVKDTHIQPFDHFGSNITGGKHEK